MSEQNTKEELIKQIININKQISKIYKQIQTTIRAETKMQDLKQFTQKLKASNEFLRKSNDLMKKEIDDLNENKLFQNDVENGIMIGRNVERVGTNNNDFSRRIRISIDLTKHSNPSEYKEKIDEICKFINKIKKQKENERSNEGYMVCKVIKTHYHDKDENIYLVDCEICYSYSFNLYHQKYKLKSLI